MLYIFSSTLIVFEQILNNLQGAAKPYWHRLIASWSNPSPIPRFSNIIYLLRYKQAKNPGLPLLRPSQTPTQKTHFLTLTKHQSTHLVQEVKRITSPNANITHLGHAAMVLALLRSQPWSQTSSQALYSPCWLNGRRYLRSSTASPIPTKSYIPVCVSFAPVIFTDLQNFSLPQTATKSEIRATLINACQMATAEYSKIRRRKSILPESIALPEELGRKMWEYVFCKSCFYTCPLF